MKQLEILNELTQQIKKINTKMIASDFDNWYAYFSRILKWKEILSKKTSRKIDNANSTIVLDTEHWEINLTFKRK